MGENGALWQTQGFAEMGGRLGVIASNGAFGVVSLQVECKDARNCTVLIYRDGTGGWSIKSMWCIPGRGCRVKFVMNIGFWAKTLAGDGCYSGNYGGSLETRRAKGWCGEVEESSGLGGRWGDLWYFLRYTYMGMRTRRNVGDPEENGKKAWRRSGSHV